MDQAIKSQIAQFPAALSQPAFSERFIAKKNKSKRKFAGKPRSFDFPTHFPGSEFTPPTNRS